jgi:hypothetical protein
MCPLPREDSVEEGLTSSLFRIVQDERQTEQLREGLSAFSHRCRNLLSGMKMGLHFVRRGSDKPLSARWTEVEQTYVTIEQLFDRLQSIYRPMKLTLIRARFASLVEDRRQVWRHWLGVAGANLEMSPPEEEIACEFDPMHLSMGLDAMVGWRGSALVQGDTAHLNWRFDAESLEVTWRESRNGSHQDAAVKPQVHSGVSGTSTVHSLAMPLLARVMSAHHGSMEWMREPAFEIRLRWPLDQPACTVSEPESAIELPSTTFRQSAPDADRVTTATFA